MLVSLALVAPALAGTPVPARALPPQPAAAGATARGDTGSAPTRVELEDFAQAVVAVGGIKRDARPGIVAAATPAERTRLEQAATAQIKGAIRSHHLTLHRYLQIVAFVGAHPQAQRQVVALMKQLPIPPPPPYQPLH